MQTEKVKSAKSISLSKSFPSAAIRYDHYSTLQRSNSSLKANVFCVTRNGRSMVVKDYSHARPLIRSTLCKVLIYRETAALKKLQGFNAVPEFYGRYGQHGFSMQALCGEHPTRELLANQQCLRDQLRDAVNSFHSAGVTHNDLRMANMLLDKQGQLFIIDYASAFRRDRDGDCGLQYLKPLKHLLFTILRISDQAKMLRFLQLSTSFKASHNEQQVLNRAKRLHILADCWKALRRMANGFERSK